MKVYHIKRATAQVCIFFWWDMVCLKENDSPEHKEFLFLIDSSLVFMSTSCLIHDRGCTLFILSFLHPSSTQTVDGKRWKAVAAQLTTPYHQYHQTSRSLCKKRDEFWLFFINFLIQLKFNQCMSHFILDGHIFDWWGCILVIIIFLANHSCSY